MLCTQKNSPSECEICLCDSFLLFLEVCWGAGSAIKVEITQVLTFFYYIPCAVLEIRAVTKINRSLVGNIY